MSDQMLNFDTLFLSDLIQGDNEFIPLLSADGEESLMAEELPEELPILPLRNMVLFPGVVMPITVGRDKSIALIKEHYRKTRTIGVVAQLNGDIEDPDFSDLHKVGTLATIVKILQMPDGNTKIGRASCRERV